MKLEKSEKAKRGSVTVEAAIIVPIVILAILAVVYIGLLLCQKASVQSAAEMSAEAGAAAWVSGVGEIGTNMIAPDDFEKIKLYRRIFDSDSKTRLESIEAYAIYLSSQNELIRPKDTEADAVIKNHVLSRRIEVTVRKHYSIPLGNLLKIFGASGELTITSVASASIDDPAEFIKNTDYILDVEKEIENKNPELKNFADQIKNALNLMKNKLDMFLN
jgi:flagellar basal body-associated protein FliL